MQRTHTLALCAISLLLLTCQFRNVAAECLPRLKTNPEEYESCKEEICYVFLDDAMFVRIDRSMDSIEHMKPFVCRDYNNAAKGGYPGLQGVMFDIMERTDAFDSTCIWPGTVLECGFGTLTRFTADMALEENGAYKFVFMGALLDTPFRRVDHVVGASQLDDQMVVIGRAKDLPDKPLDLLLGPFKFGTWVLVVSVVIVIYIASLALSYCYVEHFGSICYVLANAVHLLSSGIDHVRLQYVPSRSRQRQSRIEARARMSVTLLRISLAALVYVCVLFYEAAIVNFLFQDRNLQLEKQVRQLTESDLQGYSVLGNSALEDVWNRGLSEDIQVSDDVLKNEFKDGETKGVPWYRCADSFECMDKILDPEAPTEFLVTYSTDLVFLLRSKYSCDDFRQYDTKNNEIIYQFNAGYLYPLASVALEDRINLDRQILRLKVEGHVQQSIDAKVGSLACPTSNMDIRASTMGIALAILAGVPFLIASTLMCLWVAAYNYPDTVGRFVRRFEALDEEPKIYVDADDDGTFSDEYPDIAKPPEHVSGTV